MPTSPLQRSPRISQRTWIITGLAVGLLSVLVACFIWNRTDPEASFQRGLNAVAKRDVPALHREVQILRRFPKYGPQIQLLRGTIFLAGENLQSAIHEFDLCSVHPATRVRALTLAGEVFSRQGRHQDAQRVLQHALTFDPRWVDAHRWLAIAYYDTGSSPLAIEELRTVAELDPLDYRPHRLMGLIHKDNEQFAQAVQDYRATLRLAPQQPSREEVLLELSQSLTKLHRYDEALKFLEQAQDSADTWACRATCEFGLGRQNQARLAAVKVIELSPNHLDGLLTLGTLEAEAGRLAQAAQYLERAVKSHPQDFTAPFKLSGVYQRMGRAVEAKEQMQRMEVNRKLREKFTDLHEAANARPQDASVRYELGETARQLKLLHLAKMWYQAALALNPKHDKARQALKNLKIPAGETGQLSTP